jgi:hypothetical protein
MRTPTPMATMPRWQTRRRKPRSLVSQYQKPGRKTGLFGWVVMERSLSLSTRRPGQVSAANAEPGPILRALSFGRCARGLLNQLTAVAMGPGSRPGRRWCVCASRDFCFRHRARIAMPHLAPLRSLSRLRGRAGGCQTNNRCRAERFPLPAALRRAIALPSASTSPASGRGKQAPAKHAPQSVFALRVG